MSTNEREITSPVNLCSPDGSRLNPDAIGFSRVPLHRCNLGAPTGNTKRWDYWAILTDTFMISSVYSDIDVIGLADVFWVNFTNGDSGTRAIVVGPGEGISLPDVPGTAPLTISHGGLDLSITDDDEGTHIEASWVDEEGRDSSLHALIELAPGHESLNVVIPWDELLFNFTSKHQARAAVGELIVGGRTRRFGAGAGDAWGVLDVGRGRWPHAITWNWGGGAGRVGARVLGLQFGAKWTAGTGLTENGFILDGKLTKIGRELDWEYSWDEPMKPWRISDPGGQLDVTLVPHYDKVTNVEASPELSSQVHQVFGTFSGFVVTDDAERVSFDSVTGFAEEARQRW